MELQNAAGDPKLDILAVDTMRIGEVVRWCYGAVSAVSIESLFMIRSAGHAPPDHQLG